MLTVGLFLLALSLLIIVHELGHFLPAKLFGMRVEKFYVFFDWPTKLVSWRRGDTEYGIGVLPLGGYVKIAGMVDESQIGKKNSLPTSPAPDEFRAKPLVHRAIVILGGSMMNIIYALGVLATLFYLMGIQRVPLWKWEKGLEAIPLLNIQAGDKLLKVNEDYAYLDRVASPEWLLARSPVLTILRGEDTIEISITRSIRDSLLAWYGQGQEIFRLRLPTTIIPISGGPADRAGLRKGDRIIALDEIPVSSFSEMREVLQKISHHEVSVRVLRGRDTLLASVRLDSAHRLQVIPAAELPHETRSLGLGEALKESMYQAYRLTTGNLKALYYILTGHMRIAESLSGPIGIARVAGKSYESGGWRSFLAFTAALSLILAVMNLLPIPLLDGGHLVFLGLEAILRKEPSYRLREIAQYVGLALIL
ncbi:MAG: RIP metalloprotease RseP, partial [Bacteroidia bacterium]|nr:RIP metalloprotease RseP [Bacteroidia bacterium]MDW8134098.1 RIP metalloprotease RseP [Bacteroidia bacterium]